MNQSDFNEFSKQLTAFAMIYDRPMPHKLVESYFQALKDFTLHQVFRSIVFIAKTAKDFPNLEDIRSAASACKTMQRACEALVEKQAKCETVCAYCENKCTELQAWLDALGA